MPEIALGLTRATQAFVLTGERISYLIKDECQNRYIVLDYHLELSFLRCLAWYVPFLSLKYHIRRAYVARLDARCVSNLA